MTFRFLAAAVAAVAVALPAPAQPAKGPPATFQTQPLGKLLEDARTVIKAFAGPEADTALKDFDKQIKDALGEKGFTGLDLTRPIVGYGELSDKAEQSGGVVVVPVTDEKDFLDLLARMKLTAEPVKGQDGLYKLTPKDGPPPGEKAADVPTRLRFKDRHAYIGFNRPDAALAADKLVPAADLIAPNETAALAYRVHLDRIPESLKKQAFEGLDQLVAAATSDPALKAAKPPMLDAIKALKGVADRVLTDGDTAFVRVRLDPATADAALEVALSGKKGTQLAKDIAARKPTTNRFAGLMTADAVAGGVFQAPLFSQEVRDAAASGIEAWADEIRKNDPPPAEYKAVFDEVAAGLARTLKSGELDLAAVMTGPNADGFYTVSGGVSFANPAKVEAALRDLHKNAPPEVKNLITLDVAKAGDVSIHEAAVGPFLPEEAKKVFGNKASVCAAFAADGVFVTFGPDAVSAMKTALAVKRGEAKALDVWVNPAKLAKVVAATDPEGGKRVAQMLGTDNKPVSAVFATVEGGDELRLRIGLSLKLLPRAAGASAEKKFEAIPKK